MMLGDPLPGDLVLFRTLSTPSSWNIPALIIDVDADCVFLWFFARKEAVRVNLVSKGFVVRNADIITGLMDAEG